MYLPIGKNWVHTAPCLKEELARLAAGIANIPFISGFQQFFPRSGSPEVATIVSAMSSIFVLFAVHREKIMAITISAFLAALGSEGPSAGRAEEMGLYGWLIGSWEMDTTHHLDDGTIQKWTGECHFGWVLEGLAIQDIWIRPKRPAPSTMYGTTLRIFDPEIGGWHIIWNDPLNQDYSRQIGRAEGKDIVQIGNDSRGLLTRWRFTEITHDSFHWIGEERSAESDLWRVTYEHLARRTNP